MVYKRISKNASLTLFAFALAYFTILFIPAYIRLIQQGELFGNDVAQYILTARCYIERKCNIFMYPYPITPLIYIIPTLVIKDPITLYIFGNFISILLMVICATVMCYLLMIHVKNDIASLAGALIFGSHLLLLDIIGWGGQAAILTTLLGILALLFVQKYLCDTSKTSVLLTSFLLLLSSLAEPFIAMYFIILTGIMLLMYGRKHKLSILTIVKKSATLLPAFTAVLALVTFIVREESVIPLGTYILKDVNVISKLISRITFSDVVTVLVICFVIVAYIALYTTLHKSKPTESPNDYNEGYKMLLISSAIALFALFLLTPSQYADRSLFLSSISLAIVVSDIVRLVIRASAASNRKIITLASICLILISLLPGKGVDVYTEALHFYYVDKDLLLHLSRFRHIDGDVLFISPDPWAFSLAYITGKNVYPTTQPVWFLQKPQINASILAFLSMLGVKWIDAGEIKVVDASPLWAQPAPAICVAKYPYFVELLRLSDGLLPIKFSPKNNESIVWHESPFYAKEKAFWNTNSTMFSMYAWDSLTIVKSIKVDESGLINITLNYTFINSFPREIGIRLISLMLKNIKVNILFSNDTQAKVELLQWFEEPWYKQYYNTLVEFYVHSQSVKLSVEFIENDEWGLPEILFTLTPITYVNSISVSIAINVINVRLEVPHIVLREDVLHSNNIKLAIISKSVHPDVLNLIQRDPNFEKLEELPHYLIYRFK